MAEVDEQRERRRMAAMQQKMTKALGRLGIDLETVPKTNREAIDIADRNLAVLRKIEADMKRRAPPTAPTPERVAHAIDKPREIEVQPGQPKAHKFEWALEGIREKLTGRQYEAAERLRETYLATEPASRVADPTAVGGSSDPSKRLGITERQEIAGRDFSAVRIRLERQHWVVIRNFILEIPKHGSERCLNVSEWGSRSTGYAGDMARAAGVMAIIAACEHLSSVWADVDHEARERCQKTDRMMRSPIGRRAGEHGWIVALWDWCHRWGRLPTLQGEIDVIRVAHDTDVKRLRQAPPNELDRWHRRRDRLTAIAFRDEDERRVRVA